MSERCPVCEGPIKTSPATWVHIGPSAGSQASCALPETLEDVHAEVRKAYEFYGRAGGGLLGSDEVGGSIYRSALERLFSSCRACGREPVSQANERVGEQRMLQRAVTLLHRYARAMAGTQYASDLYGIIRELEKHDSQ